MDEELNCNVLELSLSASNALTLVGLVERKTLDCLLTSTQNHPCTDRSKRTPKRLPNHVFMFTVQEIYILEYVQIRERRFIGNICK
jgi:hypothetical protein